MIFRNRCYAAATRSANLLEQELSHANKKPRGGVVISTCMAIEQRSTAYNQSMQGKVRAAVIVGIVATKLAGFH